MEEVAQTEGGVERRGNVDEGMTWAEATCVAQEKRREGRRGENMGKNIQKG